MGFRNIMLDKKSMDYLVWITGSKEYNTILILYNILFRKKYICGRPMKKK